MQHRTLLARRPPRVHDGADVGDLAPGVPTSMCDQCTCPGLQGFLWTLASDSRAAVRGEAEQAKQSSAPPPATAATRCPQPPQSPPPEGAAYCVIRLTASTSVALRHQSADDRAGVSVC